MNQQQLLADIADSEAKIAKREALQRLKTNPDFRLVIQDGIFKDELTNAVVVRHLCKGEQLEALSKVADSISYLYQYFNRIEAEGEAALYTKRDSQVLLEQEDF